MAETKTGKRKGAADDKEKVRKKVRIAEKCKPNAADLELVKELLIHEHGKIKDTAETQTEPSSRMQIFRAVVPHVSLYVGSIIFMLVGAHIFIRLERPYQNRAKLNCTKTIYSLESDVIDKMWQNRHNFDYNPDLDEYAETLFAMQRIGLMRPWFVSFNMSDVRELDRINDFGFVVFFILSMTSTIGYGEMQPFTSSGRLFCMIYGAIGFPLILITVADMAKFVSHFLTSSYTQYLTWKASCFQKMQHRYQMRDRRRISVVPRPSGDPDMDEEFMAEYLWENLENVQYVQLPTTLIFGMIIAYCGVGALLFPTMEDWSPLNSLYFSVISVMKIGFGDIYPRNANVRCQLIALAYIIAGMILATSCIDTVGVSYLMRLHYLGRKMGETDYLAMMKRRKYKRQRREAMYEMVGLLTFLRNMRIPTQDEMPWTPDPPHSLVCIAVTASTMTLRWEPPENNPTDHLTYTLRCKAQRPWIKGPLRAKTFPKRWRRSTSHYNMQPIEVKNLEETMYTLKGLQSFTIYEITLFAVNIWGNSARIRLLQLTEPETAPQNIRTEAQDEQRIRVMWDTPIKKKNDIKSEPETAPQNIRTEAQDEQRIRVMWDTPIKKKNDIKRYTIYYTDDLDAPYEQWQKRYTDKNIRSLSFESLDENTTYAFTIAANYISGHSPISRSLYVAVGSGTDRFREITRSSGNTITEVVGDDSDDTTEDSEIMMISTDR